ncbi:flagellar transcriptional regulator FlhD [Burkholderia sp. Bp8998]|uniref:flagellar transcriptional regulator FlhD n=1 Tax=Burkholderia sp. Bp8998 TaxID=2184557 RepID=UPI000F5AA996|nr:flagellar transcriptional regulator FlhD [Burkholderia sp. Bp8998]RQS16616.1 flagellar transcriptional activator FlhD [Burkholderia sp. Bp8998]
MASNGSGSRRNLGWNMDIVNADDAVWELNMSYLWLAQHVLQEDRATGMFRLGVTSDMANALASLSMKHMIDLASSGQMICVPRRSAHGMMQALARSTPSVDIARLHVAMTLASGISDDEDSI